MAWGRAVRGLSNSGTESGGKPSGSVEIPNCLRKSPLNVDTSYDPPDLWIRNQLAFADKPVFRRGAAP